MLRKALRDLRWTVFWYAVIGVGYTATIASYYPYVRQNTETMTAMLKTYPRSLIEAFGIRDMATYGGFVGSEVMNVIWPVLMAAFVITTASAAVAQEIEHGTFEIWLSVPAGRVRLLGAKLVALAAAIVLLVAATVAVVGLAAPLVGASVSVAGVVETGVVMTVFLATIASFTALLSAVTSHRAHAAGIAAAITLASYLAWVVSKLGENLGWLANLSIFSAYDPQRALQTGELDATRLLVLLGITVACTVAALLAFRRRNLAG
jgi:ABC-2 type transport system permease protein